MQLQIESELLDAIAPMKPTLPASLPPRGRGRLGAARRPAGIALAAIMRRATRRDSAASTPSSTRARRPSSPTTTCPAPSTGRSLDDDERALVGTEYKQVSPFAASKRGAALVARNIAAHIERHVLDKPRDWKPLVYCWRGGQRSGALALVLDQIGFRVHLLEGGYQAFRARGRRRRSRRCRQRFAFGVVCGPHRQRQEPPAARARRRGRAGARPRSARQPPRLGARPACRAARSRRRRRSTRGLARAARLDPARPVFVESESKKIGDAARARGADRAHARLAAASGSSCRSRRASRCCCDEYDFFVTRRRAFCAPPRRAACAARQGGRQALAGDGARGRIGRGRARAAARRTTTRCTEVDATQLRGTTTPAATSTGTAARRAGRRPRHRAAAAAGTLGRMTAGWLRRACRSGRLRAASAHVQAAVAARSRRRW